MSHITQNSVFNSVIAVCRLVFQHTLSDEASGVHDFYVQSRKNCCVGCGEEKHYLRYKVIPSCYRRHFPVHMKSHRSHDVVLLCLNCHHKAQLVSGYIGLSIRLGFTDESHVLIVLFTFHNRQGTLHRVFGCLIPCCPSELNLFLANQEQPSIII